jgi:hypothetical protein
MKTSKNHYFSYFFIIFTLIILSVTSAESQTWEKMSFSDQYTRQVSDIAIKDNFIFVGTEDYGMFFSDDYGATWQEINTGLESLKIRSVILVDTLCMIATISEGIYKTSINNINWKQSSNEIGIRSVADLSFDGNMIYAASINEVFKSSNSGDNWIPSNNGINTTSCKCFAVHDNVIYLGCTGSVYRSSDQAENWISIDEGISGDSGHFTAGCLAANNNQVYLGIWNGEGIYISSNMGDKWELFSNGLINSYYITDILTIDDKYVFATMGGGVFYKSINDEEWIELNDGFVTDPNFFETPYCLAHDDEYVYVGTKLNLRRLKLSSLPTSVENNVASQETIYPNPVSDIINIKSNQTTNTIEIFDALGNLLIESKIEDQIDVSSLQPGVYFLKTENEVHKFIKL